MPTNEDIQTASEIIAQFSEELTISDKEAVARAGLGEDLDATVAERLIEFFAAGGKKGGDSSSHKKAWATRKMRKAGAKASSGSPMPAVLRAKGYVLHSAKGDDRTYYHHDTKHLVHVNGEGTRTNVALSKDGPALPARKKQVGKAPNAKTLMAGRGGLDPKKKNLSQSPPGMFKKPAAPPIAKTRSGKEIKAIPSEVIEAHRKADKAYEKEPRSHSSDRAHRLSQKVTHQHVSSHKNFSRHDHADASVWHHKEGLKIMRSGKGNVAGANDKLAAHLEAADAHAQKAGAPFYFARHEIANGKLDPDGVVSANTYNEAKAWYAKGDKKK